MHETASCRSLCIWGRGSGSDRRSSVTLNPGERTALPVALRDELEKAVISRDPVRISGSSTRSRSKTPHSGLRWSVWPITLRTPVFCTRSEVVGAGSLKQVHDGFGNGVALRAFVEQNHKNFKLLIPFTRSPGVRGRAELRASAPSRSVQIQRSATRAGSRLSQQFPRLWNDPGTANRERKRMVRLLIEDITIRKGEQIQLDVRFRAGVAKTLTLPRPLSFCESHKQNPAMVAEMDRLLEDYNYADTARILNEKGFKTGDGLPLTSIAVGYVRKAYGLKNRFDRLRERGMLTMSEMARVCGVSINTIGHWRRKGVVRAHAVNDRTQFLFEHPGPNLPKKHSRNVWNKAA